MPSGPSTSYQIASKAFERPWPKWVRLPRQEYVSFPFPRLPKSLQKPRHLIRNAVCSCQQDLILGPILSHRDIANEMEAVYHRVVRDEMARYASRLFLSIDRLSSALHSFVDAEGQ